jgi:hypothetical protein
VVNQVNFPKELIKKVYLEESKGKLEQEAALKFAGKEVELQGEAEMELAGGQSWGVFGS